MTKSSKKKSIWKSRFYQVYFAVVIVILVGIFLGTVWLRGVLKDYESAQPVYVAEDVARLFERVAAIEGVHGGRFARFAGWLQDGLLFHEDAGTTWLCLNCGHIHEGTEPPQNCPVCKAVQGFSVRKGFAPFTSESA